MATLTAGDLTNLRTKQHHSNLYLSILQPTTILAALVNNGSIARGARTIAYDGGSGSAAQFAMIAADQTLEVDTATGTEYVRVKSISGNQVSGTITVAENGISWADDQVIRIKHNYEIWPVFPAIRSGIFYKDYDVAYTNQNSQPNPVAIAGPHRVGFVPFSFTIPLQASSYAIAQGASISSISASAAPSSGIAVTPSAGSVLVSVTAAGQYWLKLGVTDSNGKSRITYRCVFAYDADNMPYTDFTVQSLSADWDSANWRCSLNLTGALTLTDVPDGSLAVLWYQNYFDGTEGYVDLWGMAGNKIIYTGYLWADNDTDNWQSGTGEAAFEIISPLAYLDAITDYGTVSLEAKTSPVKWSDYASWLTVGRGIDHLLQWDTTIKNACDVLGLTGNTYGVKTLEFTEDTLLQRIQGVAYQRGIHAKLLCDRLGRLHLSQDSQMLNTAARAALDTVFSITTTDISGGVNLVRNNTTIRAFADLDGFGYSHPTSTPVVSMIPGYQEGGTSYNLPQPRGVGVEVAKQQVLNSAGAQTDANERVGRLLALANISPRELRINMRGNYLGAFDIDPAIGWYTWGVADNALKRQLGLNSDKLICRSVSHRFGYDEKGFNGTVQTTEVVLQPEASGPDGIPGNYPTTYPTIQTSAPDWEFPFEPMTPGYAYFPGGHNTLVYVATSDRITFATGVTADHNDSDLTVALGTPGYASDRATYAYTAGGAAAPTYYDHTNRLTLATGVNAAYAETLTIEKESMFSLSNPANGYGYYAGGVDNTNTCIDDTDRQTFSTGAIADYPTADLSAIRGSGIGFNGGGSYGYFVSGSNAGGDYQATNDRMVLNSGVVSNYPTGDLVEARVYPASVVDASGGYAYVAGGQDGGGDKSTAERMTLSTGVFALNAASDLSSARFALGGASDGSTYGYFVGGGGLVTADRITYATGVTAANAGSNLSAAKSYFPGINDGSLS